MMRRFVLVLLVACNRDGATTTDAGSAPPSRVASCDRVPAMSVCSEYRGSYLAQNELVVTTTCKKLQGTFVYAECPNTSLLGACALPTSELRRYYESGQNAYTRGTAEKECASFGGTFTPR